MTTVLYVAACWVGADLVIVAAFILIARHLEQRDAVVVDEPGHTLAHLTEAPADYGYQAMPEDAWDESFAGYTPEAVARRVTFGRLVDHFADLREGTYGSEDMAEWERELLFRGEDA